MNCQQVGIFVDGLPDSSTRLKLMGDNPDKLTAVINIAMEGDNLIRQLGAGTGKQTGHPANTQREQDGIDPTGTTRPTLARYTRTEEDRGQLQHNHMANTRRPIGLVCFRCGQRGHKQANCRKQHTTAQNTTAQHTTAQHTTAQHTTPQHSTSDHSTAHHSTPGHSTA